MRFLPALVIVIVAAASPAMAAEPAALAKARARYNAGDFEGAIAAAAVARNVQSAADAAGLVIARAHLERYRQSTNPDDLGAAREILTMLTPVNLDARDRVDYYVGLGQLLYLGEVFGAAAELFDTALDQGTMLTAAERRQLLDWWATALDRQAQTRAPERGVKVFGRVMTRMEEELRRDPANPVANYWLAVAARGTGDPDRAWDVAIAAWVRSSVSPDRSDAVREDLDRLVAQALIPERARLRTGRDPQEVVAMLRAEWELVKEQWK